MLMDDSYCASLVSCRCLAQMARILLLEALQYIEFQRQPRMTWVRWDEPVQEVNKVLITWLAPSHLGVIELGCW